MNQESALAEGPVQANTTSRRGLRTRRPGRQAPLVPEEPLVRGFHYTKQIRQVEVLRARGELRKALDLALECVAAAESDLEARRMVAASSNEGVLSPPPPSVTWLACQLSRELGEYQMEAALIEGWLAHLQIGQEQDLDGIGEQMKWRLATARELHRTGPGPAWRRAE
ncbi:hypothetical protein [Arthrobacter bambusae]|uniref:hypothetical protein n=1 Tax=Arthrobacter bambusae TaxID=1338426 RepID=UPI0027809AD1|nr:hypothetical protein [Arthrobacter bambusae]MDQ0029390.1 hypothetical protein [Arthrobacter bambusae]MDQ0097050.1 hypothetical protein [Arthrobacter bambusae]